MIANVFNKKIGEVNCDIFKADSNIWSLYIRYADTRLVKISKINPPSIERQLVRKVIFYGGSLPKFPSELGEFFPNLEYIDIHDCGLKEINKSDLKEIPNLRTLKLESNELKFLPADLFEYTPNVVHISFARNQIERIGSTLLDNCNKLNEADFRENKNLNFCYRKKLNNLNELKLIIERDCKIVKDLKDMAVEVLKNSVTEKNVDEIIFIANCLEIDDLKKKSENFIKKQQEDEDEEDEV